MVSAHAATMNGVDGWRFASGESDDGAVLTVLVPAKDANKLRGLGFIGVMTRGMHHQMHHLMIARGEKSAPVARYAHPRGHTDSRFLTSRLDHVLALAREHHRAAVHHRVIVGDVARPFEILLDDEDRHVALLRADRRSRGRCRG